MSNNDLIDKVAVITGGADGIGAGIARSLYNHGAQVIIADIQESKGKELAEELGSLASFIFLDATDPDSWKNLITTLKTKIGRLDILVNNAGGGGFGNLDQLTFDEWRKIIALNMDTVFLGCKISAELLRDSGGGSIVNISSTNSSRPWAQFTAYCTAKAGTTMLSKCVAQHFLDTKANIRCNTVHPGPIRTPNFERVTTGDGAGVMDDWYIKNPYSEIGETEDIGEVVAFLVSDKARYVNGLEFVAAGGTLI